MYVLQDLADLLVDCLDLVALEVAEEVFDGGKRTSVDVALVEDVVDDALNSRDRTLVEDIVNDSLDGRDGALVEDVVDHTLNR